jgi:anti-sigma factor ChrR (cupin superfamily)
MLEGRKRKDYDEVRNSWLEELEVEGGELKEKNAMEGNEVAGHDDVIALNEETLERNPPNDKCKWVLRDRPNIRVLESER